MQATHPSATTGRQARFANRVPWRWLALALVALLVGAGATWLVRRPPGANSAEVTFARDMGAHHAQAVEMATIIRDRTADENLRFFTLDIMLTQQAQLGQMQGWLAAWGQPLAGPEPPMAGMGQMMGMASVDEIERLRTLPVAEAEVLFLQLLIRHHQGGVQMAQAALAQTQRPEVTRLAQAIVNGQQSEIEYMTQQLQQRGAAPFAPLPPMQHGG